MLKKFKKINLRLNDDSWEFKGVNNVRNIVRAIVIDSANNFYFVNPTRDDDFGKLNFIETSGGGVDKGETLKEAIKRELKEELGIEVEIITYLGKVIDYYNLIKRKNLNHYFLVRIISFGEKHLTKDELNDFHLKTYKTNYEDALAFYTKNKDTKLGRLIYNREVPVLELIDTIIKENKL